ncbi:CRISPR-associated CARF protein Csa3 [Pyrobaculum calidifontis]|uniref:Transcriptional regulator, TrmB n=1 Tax=Pyrobaculum calidifontis (strain DSM 21063 / JCM 11548 / VA1) TaxID=410359 RepID=A3MVN0_PYRCJ|nr:CRISPR-associated CARF protein Csa3 [Pyrobaculum calidifontis]ABO08697.1 transcriptional regulator, TrmB [Pyrobaculum calidifontis JCM 11548]
MRLAVTVGFDADLVVRALANINADEIYLVRGVTGGEGDAKSEVTVRSILKALRRGEERVVDLRDLPTGLRQMAQIPFDAVALAGGPRALVIVAFVAAVVKRAGLFLVPEYSPHPVDVSGFVSLVALGRVSRKKLEILAALNSEAEVEEVARAVGIDVSTAYRHLSSLEEAGLVKGVGGRKKKYSVDPLVVALASLFLQNSG